MKKYSKSFIIKVTSTRSGKTKTFTSARECSESIGVSKYILTRIKNGEHPSLVVGVKEITFMVEFIADKACSLYPAWDTRFDTEPIGEQVFASHTEAIRFLSGGNNTKKSTYYRRMRMQPLGVPCSQTITDPHGFEWIITFFKEKDDNGFIPNKKKGG